MRAWTASVVILGGFLLFSYLMIELIIPFILPFVLAIIMALLLEPLVRLGTRVPWLPRGTVVGLTLLLLIAAFGGLLALGIDALARELTALTPQLPELAARGQEGLEAFTQRLFIFHAGLPPMVQEMIGDALASFQQEAQNLLPALQSALAEIAAVPRLLVDLLVAAIATFFISRDRPQLGRFFMRFMPPPWREGLQRVQQNLLLSSLRYLRAQAILISVTTILSILGLWAIGAPFALSMGLLAGIADALPVLGPALVFLPWSIFHIFMGERIFGLLLLLLFSVLAITRQLLEPKVVGDSLGLHPLAVLAGMYLGVKVFGVAGIVFGPLLALLLRVMVEAGLLPIFPDYGENEPPSDKPAGPPSPPRA